MPEFLQTSTCFTLGGSQQHALMFFQLKNFPTQDNNEGVVLIFLKWWEDGKMTF